MQRPPLLTVPEVAAVLNLSEKSVRRWIAEGRLPSVLVMGSRRVKPETIDDLIAQGEFHGKGRQPKVRRNPVPKEKPGA
jgi:excisionase family DNA binding protein